MDCCICQQKGLLLKFTDQCEHFFCVACVDRLLFNIKQVYLTRLHVINFDYDDIKCPLCRKLSNWETIKTHINNHNYQYQNTMPLQCYKCQKKFVKPWFFIRHVLEKCIHQTINCEFCQMPLSTQYSLYQTHNIESVILRHIRESCPQVKCYQCNRQGHYQMIQCCIYRHLLAEHLHKLNQHLALYINNLDPEELKVLDLENIPHIFDYFDESIVCLNNYALDESTPSLPEQNMPHIEECLDEIIKEDENDELFNIQSIYDLGLDTGILDI